MARIAPSPQVVEVEPKVRPHRYRVLMVGMQVTLALAESLLQLCQHLAGWWRAKFELPEVRHQVWLPPAVNAPPLIADEAEHTKTTMGRIIAAGC
jgi:hypothetical protein